MTFTADWAEIESKGSSTALERSSGGTSADSLRPVLCPEAAGRLDAAVVAVEEPDEPAIAAPQNGQLTTSSSRTD